MGPKVPHSTVLSADEETLIIEFRRRTLLPLDDCLYALQATIPHLTRSSLLRLLQRHGINRLPTTSGARPRQAFKAYPVGYIHIDFAEVWTEEGKLYLWPSIGSGPHFRDDVVRILRAGMSHFESQRNILREPVRQYPRPGDFVDFDILVRWRLDDVITHLIFLRL